MYTNTSPYQTGQQTALIVGQPIIPQPVPQAMQEAGAAQPGAFQAAMAHLPVQTSLTQQDTSKVKPPEGEDMSEAAGPVVFHSQRGAQTPPPVPASKNAEPQGTPVATNTSEASGTFGPVTQPTAMPLNTPMSDSGCCDSTACWIIWNDDGSCARMIDACCGVALNGCAALVRGVGSAVRDCLPSSQALHTGCNSLTTGATQCCEGFGKCIVDGLGLCKDIITCPCTVCGEICKGCCDGLNQVSCDCCSGCDCNCCDCCAECCTSCCEGCN